MSEPSWKEHFSQPISGYDPVEAQGLSELGYALLHTQIDEQEYLTWARKHFELCSVDVNFFQKNPPPIALLSRLKEVYPWGPEIMPVAEWDGHVIILALEKPQIPVPPELKPILLLAPVSSLNPYWEICLQSIEQSPDQSLSLEAPESEALEGISLDPPSAVTTLDFSSLKAAQGPPVTSPVTSPVTLSKSTPDTSISKPDNNKVNTQFQTPAAQTIPLDQEVTIIKAEPASVTNASSEGLPYEEKILECLSQYEKLYENRCYFEFNAVKKTAKVSLWPVESTKITTFPNEVSLEKDSFLKIVATTQKSYHGHMIKSPPIEKLFKEINGGLWPENITLVPILKSGEIIGGIMGWGPKSTYNMNVLREMERLAHDLSERLGFKVQDAA